MIQEFTIGPVTTTTTPDVDDDNGLLRLVTTVVEEMEIVILEIVGGLVADSGLPGQHPNGQVDEANLQ